MSNKINIELNKHEIEELIELIQHAWIEGVDSEALETAFDKLQEAKEGEE